MAKYKKCPACRATIPEKNWEMALLANASQEHNLLICGICDRVTDIMDWMGTDKFSEGDYKKARQYDRKEDQYE